MCFFVRIFGQKYGPWLIGFTRNVALFSSDISRIFPRFEHAQFHSRPVSCSLQSSQKSPSREKCLFSRTSRRCLGQLQNSGMRPRENMAYEESSKCPRSTFLPENMKMIQLGSNLPRPVFRRKIVGYGIEGGVLESQFPDEKRRQGRTGCTSKTQERVAVCFGVIYGIVSSRV